MAKNNKNKGFSLIEIVIAIAILSLLLIPIISQFSGTMRLNRRSKEMQKVNENAQYVLEYFKDTSMNTLKMTGAGEDVKRTNYEQIEMKDAMACKIYIYDPAVGVVDSGETIPYQVQKFDLETAKIGSKQTEYTRTVYMDDLSTCIKAAEIEYNGAKTNLRIAYDLPETLSTPDVSIDGVNSYFTRTNEGSLVLYDDANEFVRGIVCVQATSKIDNPNLINAGNVHSLDSEGVALVSGFATDFDDQALADIYASAMDDLRETNEKAWEVEMVNPKYINDKYITGLKKMLKVTVKDVEDGSDVKYKNYYQVSVDVVYECVFVHPEGSATASTTDQHTYNAYSQKFYYNPSDPEASVPFIYVEYQPMVIASANGASGYVEYASDDYILVDSDVEDVKLYVFKPRWDYAHKYMNAESTDFSDDEYYDCYATKDEKALLADSLYTIEEKNAIKQKIIARQQIYYTENYPDDYESSAKFKDKSKVCIHINKTSTSKPVNLYTNMDAKDLAENDTEAASGEKQFVCCNTKDYSNYFKVNGNPIGVEAYPEEYFKSVSEEENHEDRYYTVSVHMTEVDNTTNTIVLNGAKGEN